MCASYRQRREDSRLYAIRVPDLLRFGAKALEIPENILASLFCAPKSPCARPRDAPGCMVYTLGIRCIRVRVYLQNNSWMSYVRSRALLSLWNVAYIPISCDRTPRVRLVT